ncbi:Fasciclin-3, partial [Gonioctena quinquepunctata]
IFLLAAQVEVQKNEQLVIVGQNATFLCRVGVPLQYCRIELSDSRTYNLNKQLSPGSEIVYYGEGLDAGQCGFTIQTVKEKDNGIIKCTLGIISEPTESVGTMRLIVAKEPQLPELDVRRQPDSSRVFKVNDLLEASCIVKDGRPVANISWFLDDDMINDRSLEMATVVDFAKEDVHSKLQNLTRVLQPSDNGKYLRCVATHPAYPVGSAETKMQLNVKFAPLAAYEPIDKFGYQIGKVGLIAVTIEANPKPKIEWTIGGQKITEGSTDNTGRIESKTVIDKGMGRYEVNLYLATVTKEDTDTDYILSAYNDMGSQEYRIKISTSPEPEGAELGIGVIIAIVVVVLFVILLSSILIFAKVTDRWCFSGGATVIDYTTGNNEQPPHLDGASSDGVDNPQHQVSSEYINGDDLPTKKDEKVDTVVRGLTSREAGKSHGCRQPVEQSHLSSSELLKQVSQGNDEVRESEEAAKQSVHYKYFANISQMKWYQRSDSMRLPLFSTDEYIDEANIMEPFDSHYSLLAIPKVPNVRVFSNTYRRLSESGIHHAEPAVNPGRHNVNVEEQILAAFEADPTISIRVVARDLNLSIWKVWSTMHNEKKYPFHGTSVQGLEETDPARRIRFCRFLLNADIDERGS